MQFNSRAISRHFTLLTVMKIRYIGKSANIQLDCTGTGTLEGINQIKSEIPNVKTRHTPLSYPVWLDNLFFMESRYLARRKIAGNDVRDFGAAVVVMVCSTILQYQSLQFILWRF